MSLTLTAADTITGVAGSATSITYTIFGDEVAAGADTFKVLAQGQLPNAVGTLYTVPAATAAIVKGIHLVNGTAGSVTAALNVKGTAAANAILPAITILAGGFAVFADDGWNVYNSQGQKLGVGSTGATGATGAAGANGLATSGTPAVVLSTTAAAGVAATALATDAQIIAFDVTVPVTQAFADAAAAGSAAVTARRDHKHGMPTSPLGLPLGLTGAVSATRYVGATASVAPTTGTFAVGDFVITQAGSIYICTVAGTPGTWVAVSGGSTNVTTKGDLQGYSTVAARIPVGTNGQVLTADSAQALGLKWAAAGGGTSFPTIVQMATANTAATSVTIVAAASGNSLVMITDSTTGQITSPTCTNVTWTQIKTYTSGGSSYYAIWVGIVAGGSSGTSVTMTKPGTYNSLIIMEITDALTPTAGVTGSGTGSIGGVGTTLAATTAGRLIICGSGVDSTANANPLVMTIPYTGWTYGIVSLIMGYSQGKAINANAYSNACGIVIAEVT